MGAEWESYLEQVSGNSPARADLICLFLAHNEAHILAGLFRHYRAMGDVHFIVIDDRSTDGTSEMLSTRRDVTVFRPLPGSTYGADKRAWRGGLLDAFGVGKWCIVIDADERLVWRGYPERRLSDVLSDMEKAGAEAMIATMIDMYADRPISEHRATDAPLSETFDLYDDPRKDPGAYRSIVTPSRFRRNFPLPNTMLTGGMRERMFGDRREAGAFARWLQGSALDRPRHLRSSRLPFAQIVSRLTTPRTEHPPLNQTKVPLVKWQPGLRYNGGAHHLSRPLHAATEYGVLLHYAVTKGTDGIAYIAERGQHAHGSVHYTTMRDTIGSDGVTPVYPGTSRLTDIAELEPFFGEPPR